LRTRLKRDAKKEKEELSKSKNHGVILKQAQKKRRDLYMSHIDYKYTFDSVLGLEVLDIYKISTIIK